MASERLTDQAWRKSSQWSALVRSHAQLAADDADLEPRFAAHCYTYLPEVDLALPAHVQARPGACGRAACPIVGRCVHQKAQAEDDAERLARP